MDALRNQPATCRKATWHEQTEALGDLMLTAILLLLAVICFGLAAFGVVVGRVNLIAAGLFFWVLVPLIAALR